jgi:hypothetical protein
MQRSPSCSGVASRSLLKNLCYRRVKTAHNLLTILLVDASSLSVFPPALRNAFWIRFGLAEAAVKVKATAADARHANVVIWRVHVIVTQF